MDANHTVMEHGDMLLTEARDHGVTTQWCSEGALTLSTAGWTAT